MTDAAEILSRRGAKREPFRSSSVPPDDEPRANSPEDVGHTHARQRPKPAAPKSDLDVLRALGPPFEGTREAEPGIWIATIRRKATGKAIGFLGATEAVALMRARTWVDEGGQP